MDIEFDEDFAPVLTGEIPVVTLTPIGGNADLYLEEVTPEGFSVASADDRESISFSWIALAPKTGDLTPDARSALRNMMTHPVGYSYEEWSDRFSDEGADIPITRAEFENFCEKYTRRLSTKFSPANPNNE